MIKKIIRFRNGVEIYPYRLIVLLTVIIALCCWLGTLKFEAPKDYVIGFIQI